MEQIFKNVTNINYTDSLTKTNLIHTYHREHFDDSTKIIANNNNRIDSCYCCNKQMEIQQGTVLFNSYWFHNSCWKKFGANNE